MVVYFDQHLLSTLTNDAPTPNSRRSGIMPTDVKNLLYTSGTTGLPKAAIMPAGRELVIGRSTAHYLQLKPSDRFYTCMPLYHGTAHILCLNPSIHAGCTVVLG